MLIVMSGLPGTGKSATADAIAAALMIPCFSVDPIENALLSTGLERNEKTGLAAYRTVEALVEQQLRLGQSAIVDAVNAKVFIREGWLRIADDHDTQIHFIGTVCSDQTLHRERLTSRTGDMDAAMELTWLQLQERLQEFDAFPAGTLVIDAVNDLEKNVATVLHWLKQSDVPESAI